MSTWLYVWMVNAQLYIRIPQILDYTKELYLVRIEQTIEY